MLLLVVTIPPEVEPVLICTLKVSFDSIFKSLIALTVKEPELLLIEKDPEDGLISVEFVDV